MKKSHFIPLLYLITALLIISCSKSDNDTADTEKPTIILNDPVDGTVIPLGNDIHFDADFADNIALASYKIDIHNASDGHTHARTLIAEVPWIYNQIYTIENGLKNTHIHHHIPVPTEINGAPIKQGHYHLGVYLIDTAGNQQQLFIEIVIGEGGDHDH